MKITDNGCNRILHRLMIAIGVTGGMLAACNQQVAPPQYSNFLIIKSTGNLDQDFYSGHPERFGDGDFFKGFVSSLEASKKQHLLITLHGGLNSPSQVICDGLGTGGSGCPKRKGQIQQIGDDGSFLEDGGYFPVFVSWPSQLGDSYWIRITQVRDGSAEGNEWNYLTAPFYVLGDVTEGIGRSPLTFGSMSVDYAKTYLLSNV